MESKKEIDGATEETASMSYSLQWSQWQLIDSILPTGGFAHSFGIEAAIQARVILNPEDFQTYVIHVLENTGSLLLPYVYSAAMCPDLDNWRKLDRMLDATLTNEVSRKASVSQGSALMRVAAAVFTEIPSLKIMREMSLGSDTAAFHHAPVFGIVCGLLGMDSETSQRAYMFITLRDALSAATRLNLVGPLGAAVLQHQVSIAAETMLKRHIHEMSSMMNATEDNKRSKGCRDSPADDEGIGEGMKGSFTPEEENRIIQLHANMGNKWARMAAEVGNLIPDLKMNKDGQNMGKLQTGDAHDPDMMLTEHFKIPEVEFKTLALNPGVLPYSTDLFDASASSVLKQGVGLSYGQGLVIPTIHPAKRFRESQSIFTGLDGSVSTGIPEFDQLTDYHHGKITVNFGLSSPYDCDLSNYDQSSCETQQDSWGTLDSPLPSLESVDTLIQSPPTKETKSDCQSPRSSGLLEAVLYESRTLKHSKKSSGHQTSDAFVAIGCGAHSSPMNVCPAEWELHADFNSPSGHSASSLFSECTPISGSSSDEQAYNVKPDPIDQDLSYVEAREDLNQTDCNRPDVLLGSSWFAPSNKYHNDHFFQTDDVAALLGGDQP
ncbi:hypothetical protein SADUNF_Sadunf16G0119000 [Salix dunnii]|uniref:HTH myb-type domain-containing protein n=1 Tax=Salix dunnii TaxID=1413687 RepID=A0A835JAM6_9ROSI|nr:hypothetical protein SADUNF_Sadunf16G0119000 [Salix dunnii]